jgi:Starch-binding associating with outer membrane
MKKISIFFIATVLVAASSCKKQSFSDYYYNPEGAVTANVPSLWAGLFQNPRVIPKYYNLFTFLIPVLGEFSQTIGYTNTNKVYEQPVNYTEKRWDDYYTGVMAQYREIEKYYDKLSDADKAGYQLFLETARIFVYDQTAQMVDLYGDIPFNNAGQLNSTGTIGLASYDKGKDIYTFILADLKRISDYLSSATPDPFFANQLTKYDFVNGGSITEWEKYANSLRLRLAMRISYEDEATAKSIAQEILSNPTKYPVVETVAENVQIKLTGNLVSTSNDIREGFAVDPFAPGKMVDSIMVPSGDVRLPVYFTANKNGEYHGVPNTWNSSRVTDSTTANYFSRYDSTTFTQNNNFPGIILTAAEVSFMKAEAFERWGGGDAKMAYEDGIKKSIQYYYYINSISDWTGPKDPMPSDAAIAAFLANPIVAYGSDRQQNLVKIATQKWIDFNVMQAQQAWAEWRRTKWPVLYFPTDPSSNLAPNVPTRLLYPSTETILNSVNYQAVKAQDNITSKVFWDVK